MAMRTQMQSADYHQRSVFQNNDGAQASPPPTIPLVGHIITDEDMGALQGTKLQPLNLNKVVKLLTDPHSALLIDRHMHALRKVIKYFSKGFVMKDLVAVFKIINVCADRSEEKNVYIEPMLEILKICSLPFLKEKSSDEITYEQIAVESLSQLGYLMRIPVREVRLQICETLIKFYCETPSVKQNVLNHRPNSVSYNQQIVEKSDVSETLVKSLALMEDDVPVRIAVLKCLQKLSKKSASNCEQMLNGQAAKRLCERLMDPDKSGELLFRSSEILWNLLQQGDKEKVAHQLNSLSTVSQLQSAFTHELTQGYSRYHRQLRNDLLVLCILLASTCPDAPFLETGFVRQLTLYATFQEVKSHNAIIRHLKLLQNHEDFELKKLLVTLLVTLSQDPSVIPVLSDGKLLLALFSYVKANEKAKDARGRGGGGSGDDDWTVAQTEELQLHAMSALATLGPVMVEDYMTCQGNTRLLLLLEWCVGPDDFGGTGNSFHGAGGRNNKKAQMRMCLRLMRSMVSTGVEALLQDMADQGAINQITSILNNVLQRRKKDEHVVDVEMQCDMLFILSALCETDVHRKELFGIEGVKVIVGYLRSGLDTSLLTSGRGHHRLLLAAVDAVWCTIVGCYVTEDYFLEQEGVFLLIDLLEKCPKSMHNLILGCLLDLAENPKTLPHITAWHGDGKIGGTGPGQEDPITAPHLLCNMWREEERMLGVARHPLTGAITDTNKPVMGVLQSDQGIVPLPATCPSQAIVDVSENMRAKLYALFGKIGFIELPGLTTEDHVTLTIIEHFMDLKLGEVWTEVLGELEEENVRPITPDREALEAVARTVEDRAQHIAAVQADLLHTQKQQDLMDEQEHYAQIRENHRQKEKSMADFEEYVARTSNYMLLQAAKQRQELSIDASRVQNQYSKTGTFHSTDVPRLNTTAFSGREVTIPFDTTLSCTPAPESSSSSAEPV